MSKTKYYAVISGKINSPAIFTSWNDCVKVVNGVESAKHKSFTNYKDAIKYLGWVNEEDTQNDKLKDKKSNSKSRKDKVGSEVEIEVLKNSNFDEEIMILNNDINIIVSGGWNYGSDIGHYKVLIKSPKKFRIIRKDEIKETTPNRAMLLGIKDALLHIGDNNENKINIITATELGLKKAQRGSGINFDLVREVFDIIEKKNISVKIITMMGAADHIKAYINRFSK